MLFETIRLALIAVWRNALRSFLTVLGVVIGVAAVIAMVIVGQGSTASVQSEVASLGSNLLIVRPGQPGQGPGSRGGTGKPLKIQDVDAIENQISSVHSAAPSSSQPVNVISGSTNYSTSLSGTDNRFMIVREWPVAHGRDFSDGELRAGAPVCILGTSVATKLFGSGDPLGASIRLMKVSCQVIGVLTSKGASSFGTDQDDMILMPIRTFQRRIVGNQDVDAIFVAVSNDVPALAAKADIERLMRERRRINPSEDDDFNVFDMEQISTMLTGITSVLTGLLSGVAAISLLGRGDRDHEHYAGIRDRTHPRNRHPTCHRGDHVTSFAAISGRGDCAFADWRVDRNHFGPDLGIHRRTGAVGAILARLQHHSDRLWFLGGGGNRIWLFSGPARRTNGPDRGT